MSPRWYTAVCSQYVYQKLVYMAKSGSLHWRVKARTWILGMCELSYHLGDLTVDEGKDTPLDHGQHFVKNHYHRKRVLEVMVRTRY